MDFSIVEMDSVAADTRRAITATLDASIGPVQEWPVHNREAWGVDVHRALGREGFIAPKWPVENGGRDADALSERVIAEELARRQVYISKTPVMLARVIERVRLS